jgi:hypothetical protein
MAILKAIFVEQFFFLKIQNGETKVFSKKIQKKTIFENL